MTKHGVVLEDVAAARHFSFPPPRTTAAAGGGDSCRKLAPQVDLGAAVVGSWLDSMKASSPRHRLMGPLLGAADAENDDWMERHPSALDRFDALAAAAKGKQVAVFLDYDGTLSPIVEDPDRAVMTDEMREAVRGVAARFPTAIVSGRCWDKVFSFVRLAELYYAGSHGMDIRGPTADPNHLGKAESSESSVLCQPASEFLPVMEEVYAALVSQVEPSIPGAKVENNKFCLSVHFRCVEEHAWAALFEQVRAVLKDYPGLRLTQGRKVLEVRPMIRWDKGKALEFLLSALGFADADGKDDVFPIYVGDDRTDEDAFRVLRARGQGAGILVSRFPKETSASFTLRDPAEVKEFLRKLVVVNANADTSRFCGELICKVRWRGLQTDEVAGGFQGELICKHVDKPRVAFCTNLTGDDNSTTNAVDIYQAPNGATRVMAANNDCVVRTFDSERYSLLTQLGCTICN